MSVCEIVSTINKKCKSSKKEYAPKSEEIVPIPIGKLIDFKNHPFNVEDDDEMLDFVQNIENGGIIYPAIVRPIADGNYEIVSGHKRKRASELLKYKEVPCIIRNYTDEEAVIVMVDTNLKQRQRILPSEKARAYKMKLEALKRQGKRTDLTSTQFGSKLRSNEEMGEEVGESREQIRRYVRLNELILELLNIADNYVLKKKNIPRMALAPAAELSYLSKNEQQMVLSIIKQTMATPSYSQALSMKKLSRDGKLTKSKIEEIMKQEKPNQKPRYQINYDKFSKILPRNIVTAKEVEDFLYKCVEDYLKRNNIKVAS